MLWGTTQQMEQIEESGILGTLEFSFGIYFDHPRHYQMYYSGLFFKLVVQKNQVESQDQNDKSRQ